MSNITATFVNPHRTSLSTAIKKPIDFATSFYEYPAKANLKKRKIWLDYLKERKEVNKSTPTIDFHKWDGESSEVLEYRHQHNKKWAEMNLRLIEINKKYVPMFLDSTKVRCALCGKQKYSDTLIQNVFNDVTLNFCNDDHMLEFGKLTPDEQEKLIKKCTRKRKKKDEIVVNPEIA